MTRQQVQFCKSRDGTRIAYAVVGDGPVIVKAPNWLSHLEYEWESPVQRHWWQELAKDFTLIRFDQRGGGMSDWNVKTMTFDSWVEDLEAVVEATGAKDFGLLGISQGGAIAIEYAARHPELVGKLLLYGSFARGLARRGESPEMIEAMLTLLREGWGQDIPSYRLMFTSRFMPEATMEQMNWFNDLQKAATNGENAARQQEVGANVDVLDRLSMVSAPTLVMHADHDPAIPFNEGRQVATVIPGAHFVELHSNNHLTLADEPAWQVLVGNIRNFMAYNRPLAKQESPPVAAAAPSVPGSLTEREIEVLKLIAAGKSNHEIADELVISINTVTNHVKSILSKTESGNRTEAALFAYKHKIAPAG